jgi:hypothetical protein
MTRTTSVDEEEDYYRNYYGDDNEWWGSEKKMMMNINTRGPSDLGSADFDLIVIKRNVQARYLRDEADVSTKL